MMKTQTICLVLALTVVAEVAPAQQITSVSRRSLDVVPGGAPVTLTIQGNGLNQVTQAGIFAGRNNTPVSTLHASVRYGSKKTRSGCHVT